MRRALRRFGVSVAAVVVTVALADAGGHEGAAGRLVNRLGAEASEYLRAGAASPVAWQAWGEPALILARELDRPILLSIGADWCHWCLVMDRETYGDPAIAALINAHFVPIKVDRDERPDVDARFQEAARALDTAGWPLTLFLTADGRLVSGGAAFLPDERGGVPGLRALLPRALALARGSPGEARSAVTPQRLAQVSDPAARPAPLSPRLAADVVDAALGELDLIHGGFGHEAKQVPGALLTLVARRLAETGDPRLREALTRTLDAMARGAIRDHLGGGFFRDTTDRAWRRPRFERLDVIQAQVIGAYLLGYQATGAPRFRAVAEEVLAYAHRTLARPGGGFNAGQEPGDPGHFLWNEADVRAALPAAEADLMVRHFGLGGVVERRALAIDVGAADLAAAARVPVEAIERRLAAARDRLRQVRSGRGEPAIDTTVYADRSARLASAYLEAYKVLGGDERLSVALDTLELLWTRLRQPNGGMAHAFRDGRVTAAGTLDDQFAVAGTLLDAFEITGAVRHLNAARALVDHAVARFGAADGGFFDTPAARAEGAPAKSFVDADRPGGNALAALVLDRLHDLTNDQTYRTLARDTLAALPAADRPPGRRLATYAHAADVHVNGSLHVVVAGKASDPRTPVLWRNALRAFRPGKIVAAYDPDVIDAAAVPAPVAAMLRQTAGAEPRAYVCSGTVCSLPQTDADQLRELVERLGRRP